MKARLLSGKCFSCPRQQGRPVGFYSSTILTNNSKVVRAPSLCRRTEKRVNIMNVPRASERLSVKLYTQIKEGQSQWYENETTAKLSPDGRTIKVVKEDIKKGKHKINELVNEYPIRPLAISIPDDYTNLYLYYHFLAFTAPPCDLKGFWGQSFYFSIFTLRLFWRQLAMMCLSKEGLILGTLTSYFRRPLE